MPRYISELPLSPALPEASLDAPGGWLIVPPSMSEQPPEDEDAKHLDRSDRLATTQHPYIGDSPLPGTVSILGPNRFELTVTEKLHNTIAPYFHDVRRAFTAETQRILADPFGESCIDTNKDTDAGQWFRLVHAVTGPLAEVIPDRPLALKATGLEMERQKYFGGSMRVSLAEQFRAMHGIGERQREWAPEGLGKLITVNEVHGVLRYADPTTGKFREWMLMDHVTDAKPVKDVRLVLSNGGVTPGFERAAYPELADYVHSGSIFSRLGDYPVRFAELGEKLSSEMGQVTDHFVDLRGDNLLEHRTEDGQPRYTVIDINGHLGQR